MSFTEIYTKPIIIILKWKTSPTLNFKTRGLIFFNQNLLKDVYKNESMATKKRSR